jgi:serine/threonine-protein kinase
VTLPGIPAPGAIQLRVLGAVDIDGGGSADALLSQPKRLAVLLYLALARPRGFHRRDRIVGLFWPEQSDAQARAALRKALHAIRQALGNDVLLSRGDEEVALAREKLWCDAVAFDAAIDAENFARALELFRGDLLAGFFTDAPGFEMWLEGERDVYRDAASNAAWTLAERYEQASDLTSAARWARKAARFARADERRIRRVIQLLDRAGERAGAVQVYDEFARYMRDELEVTPAVETARLIEEVRRRVE